MEASFKDLAEFARFGLQYRVLAPASVTAWADGVIASGGIPEPWLIDLALAHQPEAIEDALSQVPGEPQADLALSLFLALVLRRWRSGDLSIGDVRGIGWLLHCEALLTAPEGKGDWGVCLEVMGEELDDGWRTEDDLRTFIDDQLAEYSNLEMMLPTWA